MSTQPANQAEPTMEEILASIRKIISEDTPGEKANDSAPEAPEAADAAPLEAVETVEAVVEAEEVLELTEVVEDAPAEADVLAEPEPQAFRESEPVMHAAAPAPAEEDDLVMVDKVQTAAPETDEGLLSGSTRSSLENIFGNLQRNLRVSEDPGQTLDGMVKELLKPALRDWLEAHLPKMVEEIVRDEVERVIQRSRRG